MAECTFCGSSQRSVSSLVAGPGVFICDSCVAFARSAIGEADSIAPGGGSPGTTVALACSFCDRTAQQVRRIIAGPDVRICDQCVQFAGDVLAGRAG